MTKTTKKRYRYKLNMLEPGLFLCKTIGILGLTALVLYLLGLYKIAVIVTCFIAAVFLIMIILILIEQRQDHMLYLDAKKDDADIK